MEDGDLKGMSMDNILKLAQFGLDTINTAKAFQVSEKPKRKPRTVKPKALGKKLKNFDTQDDNFPDPPRQQAG